jgi:hypothetical protein
VRPILPFLNFVKIDEQGNSNVRHPCRSLAEAVLEGIELLDRYPSRSSTTQELAQSSEEAVGSVR